MINPYVVDEVLAGEDGVVNFSSLGASEGEIEDEVVFLVEGVSFFRISFVDPEAVVAGVVEGEVNPLGVPLDGVGVEILPWFVSFPLLVV